MASSGGKTGTSNTFVVNPGAKSKLVITTQPAANGNIGVDLSPDPAVAIQDANGNTITTDSTDTVSIATVLSTQSCGGTAGSGTVTANPTSGSRFTNGVLTYSTFSYSTAQSVKFCFSSSGVTSALSNTVNIIAPFVKLQVLLPGETAHRERVPARPARRRRRPPARPSSSPSTPSTPTGTSCPARRMTPSAYLQATAAPRFRPTRRFRAARACSRSRSRPQARRP